VEIGRRKLLAASALGVAGMTLTGRALARGIGEPDLLVVNANIYTVDPLQPRARAVAIQGDHFLAVGSDSEVRALAGKQTRIVDARGATIVPGFNDCHLHAEADTLLYETLVGNPYEVEFVTIASIVGKLQDKASKTPTGDWVFGFFYDDTKVKDGRVLTRADLDRVSTTHPVLVLHRGGHTAFVNGKSFALAGVNRDTPDPAGGTFDRDSKGELTGRITDSAMDAFYTPKIMPSLNKAADPARARAAAAFMSSQFARYGLTSVSHSGDDFAALQGIRADGKLLHRISYECDDAMLDHVISAGIASGLGDEWIRFGATIEHTHDGSFSERTMALSRPYPGRSPPYSGNIAQPQDQLNAWAERMYRAGIRPNIHANGDVAIDMALKAYEHAAAKMPAARLRPKITHCTYINPDLIRRIKAVDAIPAPFTTYLYYNSDKFAFYGEEMMKNCLAFRSFLDAGIPVVAGSDFPPGPFSPLMGIQGMVTRIGFDGRIWGANQRITVEEAIRIYTLNGAISTNEEHMKGSITPGKLADFVLLGDDPHHVEPGKIKDIQIVETYTGGKSVFHA
jgi:predicted amidohydrolase YtcJ